MTFLLHREIREKGQSGHFVKYVYTNYIENLHHQWISQR